MPRKQRFKPSRKPLAGEATGQTLVGNRPEVPVTDQSVTEPSRRHEDATTWPRSATPAVIE